MKRGLQELVSIGQVVIVLSCQLVLIMFLLVMGITETADQSCELNIRYLRTYSAKVFHLPFSALTLSPKRQKPPQVSVKTFLQN